MSPFKVAKDQFLQALDSDQHPFSDTLAFIQRWYDVTPSAFQNGPITNSKEQNQGSCQVLALSERLALEKEQTLRCFGEHYRDVLATPEVDNHHNLRRLLRDGINDIHFDTFPLTEKQA